MELPFPGAAPPSERIYFIGLGGIAPLVRPGLNLPPLSTAAHAKTSPRRPFPPRKHPWQLVPRSHACRPACPRPSYLPPSRETWAFFPTQNVTDVWTGVIVASTSKLTTALDYKPSLTPLLNSHIPPPTSSHIPCHHTSHIKHHKEPRANNNNVFHNFCLGHNHST